MHNNSKADTLFKWPVSPHLLHAVTPPLSVNAETAARSRGLDMLKKQNSVIAYG
jgi:hypothetical protein